MNKIILYHESTDSFIVIPVNEITGFEYRTADKATRFKEGETNLYYLSKAKDIEGQICCATISDQHKDFFDKIKYLITKDAEYFNCSEIRFNYY